MPHAPKLHRLNCLSGVLGLLSICAAPAISIAQAQAPDVNLTSAHVEIPNDHFHGGSDLTFKIELNEPLPEGARFDVRLSPVGVDQEIPVSSGEPANKERTEFILKTKLPEKAAPGEWHIKVVWLFLPGASWTSNTLATNADFRFVVEGPKIEIPTKATATLVSDHR
jgi:hypothetical protein